MNKYVFRKVFILLSLFSIIFLFSLTACEKTVSNNNEEANKGHVIDSEALNMEEIVDDFIGENGSTEKGFNIIQATIENETKIKLGTDTDKYELGGGLGITAWNNGGNSFPRAQVTSGKASGYITFTLDFSNVQDKTNIGCKINLISCRKSVEILASTDKISWKPLAFNEDDGIICDYQEHLTSLDEKTVNDENISALYYFLSDYIDTSNILYLKCGYNPTYYTSADTGNNGIGIDLIDHISYFDSLKLIGEANL